MMGFDGPVLGVVLSRVVRFFSPFNNQLIRYLGVCKVDLLDSYYAERRYQGPR